MTVSDLCTTFITSKKLKDESERNIIEFSEAPWGLGFGSVPGVPSLFPVQRFILKCAYNIPLDDSEKIIIIKDKFCEKERFRFSEMEYLDFLYNEGRINIKNISGDPKDPCQNLLLVMGRRSTKTHIISIIVAYETYKLLKRVSPQEYYGIMPDDEIRMTCIATNQEQASILFKRISGHLERSDYFKKYRRPATANYMQLNTQRDLELYAGSRPSIKIVSSPCSGRGIRGPNNIIAVLDEMAYFFEAETSDDKSDETIYDAVTPSVAKFNAPDGEPHGRVICISSPASRSGKFFDLYERSMEKDCQDLLMLQAPTWEVDVTQSPKFFRSKYSENPTSYMAEYGAQFSDRISTWIENEQVLRMNIIPGLREKKSSGERVPHFIGIDIALKNDGSALAICHITRKEVEGVVRNLIELDCAEVRYAANEGKEFFHSEELVDWIYSYSERFFIVKGMLDQYGGLFLKPLLDEKGLKQIEVVPSSRESNSRVYQNLMSKMLDASLRIPEGDEKVIEGQKTTDSDLIRELLRLKATNHSKYLISVEAPEGKGSHDDLSDAFARAVFLATDYLNNSSNIIRNNVIETAGSGTSSYRQYHLKQKRNVLYTNRPSSGIQADIMRSKQLAYNSGRMAGNYWR